MLRIQTCVDLQTSFHFVVSNLVHRGGWELIDSLYGSAWQAPPAWPTPDDPTGPGGVNDLDRVILRAPHPDLAGCFDVIDITLNLGGGTFDVSIHRLGDGTVSPWDEVGHVLDGSTQTLGPYAAGINIGNEIVVFSSQRGACLADVDTGANFVSGGMISYLETMVLTPENPTPQLGAGPDPFPAALTPIDNTMGPWFTAMPTGEVFNDLNVPEQAEIVLSNQDLSGNEMMQEPITFGGGVPTHGLLKCPLIQNAASPFLRGTLPNLFVTSREVALSTIRLDATGDEFFVLATRVAVGPL